MKRKTAKDILADSFHELARSKNINKITVKEITDNCGYSPATFYRQFKDKYDLIAWEYTRSVSEIMDRVDTKEYQWRHTLKTGAKLFYEQRDYLANLFLHTTGHDSFVRYMTEINFNALKKHILKSIEKEKLSEEIELYIRIYCMGTVNITCEWILGKFTSTPDELAKLYENSLPMPLRAYLL